MGKSGEGGARKEKKKQKKQHGCFPDIFYKVGHTSLPRGDVTPVPLADFIMCPKVIPRTDQRTVSFSPTKRGKRANDHV